MSGAETAESNEVISARDILDILPHRYPFLLVDKIVSIDLENNEIVGQKSVSFNESFFQGHFPGLPIMPGVLIIEALAQAGGVLAWKKGYQDKIAVLLTVNNAKFRRPVHPGDTLTLHVSVVMFSSKGGRVKAVAKVGDKVAAEAEIGYAFASKDQM